MLILVGVATSISSVADAAAIQKRSTSGYNDFSCKPSAAHPRPVILVHGTVLTNASWELFGPAIASQGYCVFSLTYGRWENIPIFAGIAPIEDNAAEVGAFADQVLAATGNRKS